MELIKKLRETTGAKIIDCKAALDRNNGDYDAALKELSGNVSNMAEKKQDRETKQGIIVSYIHNNLKLGIMLELFCETDFVARNQEFQELAKNLAMQFAVVTESPVVEDSVDGTVRNKTRLDQIYIKDPSKTVGQLINEYIAKLGENIVIGRYTRYELGVSPHIAKFDNGNF